MINIINILDQLFWFICGLDHHGMIIFINLGQISSLPHTVKHMDSKYSTISFKLMVEYLQSICLSPFRSPDLGQTSMTMSDKFFTSHCNAYGL